MKGLLSTLGARVTALTLAVVLATATVGSIAAVLLVQRANDAAAARSLAATADVAQSLATLATSPELGLARAKRALDGVQVQVAIVRSGTPRGTVVTGDPLPRRLLTEAVLAQLVAGQDVSLRVPDDDGQVFLEGRATEAGAIVLAQRRSDAVALGQDAVARMRWAFALVALVSVLVGWAVSRRMTTPLRRMAAAAGDLASGARDVAVPESGPAEVAAVGAALNELARSLAHSEARQREFLLSVSHDLRTPLTAVTGYAESLADGVIPPEGVAEVGRIVGAEAARLDRLVQDLLDLARLDAHEVTLTMAAVDLAGLLASAEPVWRRRCDAVGVAFGLELPAVPLVVTADPDRLRQALDGLVDNALRATPAGRPVIGCSHREWVCRPRGSRRRPRPGAGGLPGGVRAIGAARALSRGPRGRDRSRAGDRGPDRRPPRRHGGGPASAGGWRLLRDHPSRRDTDRSHHLTGWTVTPTSVVLCSTWSATLGR
ncbi:MAG TPA: HAMP domain-containing sensor histidine kinase [Dermatophilaceae bacterium]|nr:HAMP domain-containing sensor histidine kinase [Dermatophilaceae bacterium]